MPDCAQCRAEAGSMQARREDGGARQRVCRTLSSCLERFRRSVRLKLLALVLAPLLVGVPLLLALVWTWGNQAYERLITYKVGSDLVTAQEYFDRVRLGVGHDVAALAESAQLINPLARMTQAGARTDAAFSALLQRLTERQGLDFLLFLDASGQVRASARAHADGDPGRRLWPVVEAALTGEAMTSLERFEPEALDQVALSLRARARQPLMPTRAAAPDPRQAEERGLVIHSAAPVYNAAGVQIGVLEGGLLLNGNLELVDRINAIVYRDGSLPLGSQGTATLFLGDTRIATNVRLFEGERALGTRVSAAVRDQVLGRGERWLGTAFVVNDDYVSGYEPLLDSAGERVGMLYVGFLEAPLRTALYTATGLLFLLFIAISVAGALLSLRWARGVFEPLERMNRVIQRVEQGDARARVGPLSSQDELGRLAMEFDHLLDTLSAKQHELQQWAFELDRKVAERTAELQTANETLKKAGQQLIMSEKLAAIGELTAGVAHEVNNPVAVIQGNLDLLREVLGEAAAPVREEIRLIHQQTERIRQIVTRLLQFARPGDFAGYLEPVHINELLADCLLLTRHNLERRAIHLETRLEARRVVEINRSELQQVLINLIINAVQAMPEGGTLTLVSEDVLSDDDEQVPGVCIRVQDTGAGIPAEHLGRIFDPFFTTKKAAGTGLGLSISYAIVQRYGGQIAVESVPGRGTVFSVCLREQPRLGESPAAPAFMARWQGVVQGAGGH